MAAYMMQPMPGTGLLANVTRRDAHRAGAIGAVAADKYEPSKYREGMNLQFGMVAARPSDVFLMASDGLWDALDPVQVLARPPVERSAARSKCSAACHTGAVAV